jgi:hypothetical protein
MSGVLTLLSARTSRVWSGVLLCLDGYGGLKVLLLLILPLSLWGVTSCGGGGDRCFSLLFVCLLALS